MISSYTESGEGAPATNPWLRWMVVSGTATVLIGLVTMRIGRKRACSSDGRFCVDVASDGFTDAEVVGLGLVAIGFLALVGWMAAKAICWQLSFRADAE